MKDVEWLTDELTPAVRSKLRIRRRVPDTTLRDMLTALKPDDLRPALHSVTRAALRRKALEPEGLPFGVVSLDGKGSAVPAADDFYAQRQTADERSPLVGIVRTVTATLTSSNARPVIDVMSIPAKTNEMGVFERMLDGLMAAYGNCDLFRLVTYDPGKSLTRDDAGACSKQNAQASRDRGLHYLMAIKSTQPTLYEEAVRWLGEVRRHKQQQPAATSTTATPWCVGSTSAKPAPRQKAGTTCAPCSVSRSRPSTRKANASRLKTATSSHSWDFQGSFRACRALG